MAEVAFVGLGSNVGDRLENLRRAVALLAARAPVHRVSPVYETEPVGFRDQAWFLNCVVEVEAAGGAEALHAATKDVERVMGKATPFPDGPRVIDLDILLLGDAVLEGPTLRVPHPRMHERRFVLAPLADLAPDVPLPGLGSSAAEALERLPETEQVRLYATGPWAGERA